MGLKQVPEAAILEMRRLYEDLDAEVARVEVAPCRRCGACCHFGSSGLYLYLSTLEAAVMFHGWDRGKGGDGEICPYLSQDGCSNRQNRSVGCRTYFCGVPGRVSLQGVHEKYLKRAREIAEGYGLDGEYAPLMVWLERL